MTKGLSFSYINLTASSIVVYVITGTIGPKISSCMTAESKDGLRITVGYNCLSI